MPVFNNLHVDCEDTVSILLGADMKWLVRFHGLLFDCHCMGGGSSSCVDGVIRSVEGNTGSEPVNGMVELGNGTRFRNPERPGKACKHVGMLAEEFQLTVLEEDLEREMVEDVQREKLDMETELASIRSMEAVNQAAMVDVYSDTAALKAINEKIALNI
jgi:hypothetical protein